MNPIVAMTDIEKCFRDRGGKSVSVLNALSLTIGEGESYVLLGPSGCGKTTTLRLIAGLDKPSEGRIVLAGHAVYARNPVIWVPPERRPIGMVFQSYALWPNMTVAENVLFTLKHGRERLDPHAARKRTGEVLGMLQISDLAKRPVTKLSGGQQQRVALARAIAQRPRVLLMDEPLSNLDPQLRNDVRTELRELSKRLGITSVIVTHDRDDATSLADRVAVMSEGCIIQEAAPTEITRWPATLFVAKLFGEVNVLDGTVRKVEKGIARIAVAGVEISVAAEVPGAERSVMLGIRPRRVRIGSTGIPAEILGSYPDGEETRIQASVAGRTVTFYTDAQACSKGEIVRLQADEEAWMVFPETTRAE